MNESSNSRIGSLNGKWSILFRALLSGGAIILPIFVALEAWQSLQIHGLQVKAAEVQAKQDAFYSAGPRYTERDARLDNLQMRREIFEEVNLSLKELRRSIIEIDKSIQRLEDNLKLKNQ